MEAQRREYRGHRTRDILDDIIAIATRAVERLSEKLEGAKRTPKTGGDGGGVSIVDAAGDRGGYVSLTPEQRVRGDAESLPTYHGGMQSTKLGTVEKSCRRPSGSPIASAWRC